MVPINREQISGLWVVELESSYRILQCFSLVHGPRYELQSVDDLIGASPLPLDGKPCSGLVPFTTFGLFSCAAPET